MKKVKCFAAIFAAMITASIIGSALLPVSAAVGLQENNPKTRMSFREKLESVPRIQVVETYIPIEESDISNVLRDIDSIEDGSYDAIMNDESVLKTFFDIYENTAQNQELINQINAPKSGFSQVTETVTVMDLLPYLPSNTPFIHEISEIRIAEQKEQSQLLSNAQLLGDDVQPFGPAISYYFNVNLGRQYAIRYAASRNTLYRSFWYDCTNFVSQILHEGGVPMTSKWWIEKNLRDQDYSTAWVNVNAFCNYLGIDHRTTVLNNFSMYLRVGDVIAFDRSGDCSYDHVGFVTTLGTYDWYYNGYGKRQYYRDFMVAQHTNHYHLWASNPGNGWDDLETFGAWYARVWTR